MAIDAKIPGVVRRGRTSLPLPLDMKMTLEEGHWFGSGEHSFSKYLSWFSRFSRVEWALEEV